MLDDVVDERALFLVACLADVLDTMVLVVCSELIFVIARPLLEIA